MSTIIDTLIFDRTNANLVKGDPKGKYDYRDYNRVESAVEYIVQEAYSKMGCTITVNTKTDWVSSDIPRITDILRYTGNVKAILDELKLNYNLPYNYDVLTILGANQLEKALYDAHDFIQNVILWSDVDTLNETWDELDAKQLKWNEYFVGQSS